MIIQVIKSTGKTEKRTEQTRYMLMSLKETYAKFVEEHPSYKIGLSKFCELRPNNVKLFDHIPCLFIPRECTYLASSFEGSHRFTHHLLKEFLSQVTAKAVVQFAISSGEVTSEWKKSKS